MENFPIGGIFHIRVSSLSSIFSLDYIISLNTCTLFSPLLKLITQQSMWKHVSKTSPSDDYGKYQWSQSVSWYCASNTSSFVIVLHSRIKLFPRNCTSRYLKSCLNVSILDPLFLKVSRIDNWFLSQDCWLLLSDTVLHILTLSLQISY